MRRWLISTTIVMLTGPAWAQGLCVFEVDPMIGPEWNCNPLGISRPSAPPGAAGGSLAQSEAACGGNQYCINQQRAIWDGGVTNGLGVATAAAGVYAVATGDPVAGFAAAIGALGTAIGQAMGDMGISPSDAANAASDAAAAEGVGGTGY